MNVDGVEISFEPGEEGRFRVLAGGREVGTIELSPGATDLVAFRPDGEPLKARSKWGGEIAARFGSREVAARALIEESLRRDGGRMPERNEERTR